MATSKIVLRKIPYVKGGHAYAWFSVATGKQIGYPYPTERDARIDGRNALELLRWKEKNPIRTAPKSAIPAKFVTAKVRRVGGKVQILLNR